ncbi:MAG: hypothetical protein NW205_03840 [Hyphomicrobiaceae bacterium]|nr:hypothetical protein [Hyphomicrobiaceae bacterium]
MHRLNSAFILGYHGCSDTVAEQLFSGRQTFRASNNDYDWLGPGIYFWQANPMRARQFAEEKRARDKARWKPRVVGAVIELGLCLDVSTAAGITALSEAYEVLSATMSVAGKPLPSNSGGSDRLLRRLDCAVVKQLHGVRSEAGQAAVDTVRGIFLEGTPLYEGSGFLSKTHVQVCVCNPGVIRGVFRVPAADMREW